MDKKEHITIGEAVTLLQKEFPDLASSSLRFLEKESLLYPQRTSGGHRLYSDDDIARIRLIKHLQLERHYPLDVIRHMLAKLEHTKDQEAEIAFLESLYRPLSYDPDFNPLSRVQLAENTGLSPANITRLEDMGLLFPHMNDNGQHYYDEDDLKLTELIAQELELNASLDDFAAYGAAMQISVQEEFNLFYKLAGSTKPTLERSQQLTERANLLHTLLRAKLRRQIMIEGKSQ